MGLISKQVETKVNNRNKKHYQELGYDISKQCGHKSITIIVNVKDIPRYSLIDVQCQCDNCNKIYDLHYSDYLRRNHEGKIYCNNCAQKIFHSGDKNNRWNPDLTDEDRLERRIDPEYTEFTRKVLQRDNYTCKCCNKQGSNLEVHHINGFNWDKEGRLDFSNVVTLCKACHNNFHDKYGRGNNTKQQFEEWLGYAIIYQKEYNGVLPPTREIICIEDNKIFKTSKEAAEYANTTIGTILKCCQRQESIKYGQYTKTVHGKHYIYLSDYNSMSEDEFNEYWNWSLEAKTYKNNKHPNSKSVVCLNTKTVFKSGRYASQIMHVSSGGLCECCQHKKEYCGTLSNGEKINWMYLSEYLDKYNDSELIYYEQKGSR